jgi:hypothetical protein
MKDDGTFRLEPAETVGLRFAVPFQITDVVRIVRKHEARPEVKNAA